METLYVLGGRQRGNAHFQEEWRQYREALIVRVDVPKGRAEVVARHVSPPETCPDEDPSILFKAGALAGNRLVAPTQTEILTYALPGFQQVGALSLPAFNDLHHARPAGEAGQAPENLLVAVTGLDMVVEVTPGGEPVREWSVLGGDPWERFDRGVDYRRVATTKPHRSHPNFVFTHGREIWVTRFEQRDAICLTAPGRRIPIGVERPHDGVVAGGRVYFTTVDGQVVVAGLETCAVERVIDLNRLAGHGLALGWCRGLEVVDSRHVLVGFSRLRPSRFRENLRWVKHRFGRRPTAGDLPTRVALYDLAEERLLWEVDLEGVGLNALFSIHRAP